MRVELDVGVFEAGSDLSDVLDLLRCFAEERHDWVAKPEVAEAAGTYFADECPLRAMGYAEMARKAVVAAAAWGGAHSGVPEPPQIRVTAGELSDLAHDLCRAAVVVVEDQMSDTCFLRLVADAFGRSRITTALERGWLEPRHAGGKDRMARFATEAAQLFRRCVRVVAFLDSDSYFRGHRTRCHDIATQLSQLDIPAHVLGLREVENYVPHRILAGIPPQRDRRRVLDALKTMTPEQRGHFDMKHGLGAATREPKIPVDQQELYRNLDPSTLRALRGGFGADLVQQMELQLSAGARLTEQDFAALGEGTEVVEELRSLLEMVDSVI